MASSGTTSTRKRFTGAEFIVHFLEQQGIKIVTGIPGGSILPVYDALSQSTQIRHILARHEQGAGFIAQGMARTDGKPAVCMACSGPGATNLVTAIADARLDSIPLICITGTCWHFTTPCCGMRTMSMRSLSAVPIPARPSARCSTALRWGNSSP